MAHVTLSSDLVEEIAAKRSITAEDVLALRREVFKDSIVDPMEAQAIFRLDHACSTKDPAWTQFYVDALTDFFVWQAEPRGYVNQDLGRFLIQNIAGDGRVDGASELELLINVIHWATSCPEELVLFVMDAVADSVLRPGTAVYGSNRPPAVISPADVEVIRKVIYAGASGGGFTVTRREADLIFDLNNAAAAEDNAPAWGDLFVKAIANHLMFPHGAPMVPSTREARHRERWLEERGGVGQLLGSVGKAFGTGDIPVSEAWKSFDPFGTEADRAERAREEGRVREALAREAIDADEARWLIGRIDEDGVLHDNERALLTFIKRNSPSVHPSLAQLFDKVGI
jgi:hypothetical protein